MLDRFKVKCHQDIGSARVNANCYMAEVVSFWLLLAIAVSIVGFVVLVLMSDLLIASRLLWVGFLFGWSAALAMLCLIVLSLLGATGSAYRELQMRDSDPVIKIIKHYPELHYLLNLVELEMDRELIKVEVDYLASYDEARDHISDCSDVFARGRK
ncbi:hypothetical protein VCHA53O466_140094 [Vibrio chagasii]|nr:hypothetical protein VCHA53O466_140094 [Vibrio chagasii]